MRASKIGNIHAAKMTQSFERETRYVFLWKKILKGILCRKVSGKLSNCGGRKGEDFTSRIPEGGAKFVKGKIFGDKDAKR